MAQYPEWQPIETAPKDLTEFDDEGFANGRAVLAYPSYRVTFWARNPDGAEGWVDRYDEHSDEWQFVRGCEAPKYWMPLPPAPTAAARTEKEEGRE